jgi:hypothetical protein
MYAILRRHRRLAMNPYVIDERFAALTRGEWLGFLP